MATAKPQTSPCLVVHPDPLVAEDLRDILLSEGAQIVEVAPGLSEVRKSPVHVAFVAGRPAEVLGSHHAQVWAADGVPLVLFDGDGTLAHGDGAHAHDVSGVHVLAQPFRTEDVTTLLRRLSLF